MKKDGPMSNLAFNVMVTVMTMRGFFRNTKEELLQSRVSEGDIVLDYGCGIGLSTLPAAEMVGPAGKVYALDIHPLAIQTIEKKARKKGLANVKTILSGLDTGIPDETVDVALLFNVLPMIQDRPAVIKEIYRVLKPGGVLSVTSGLGARLYGREEISSISLEKLVRDNGPLELKEQIGKFCIFEKV